MIKPEYKCTGKQHDLLVCACSDPQHQIVFTRYDGDGLEKAEVFVYIHLTRYSFWKRLWVALQYVFGKQSQHGAFDEILLTPTEMYKLEDIIADYKKRLVNENT